MDKSRAHYNWFYVKNEKNNVEFLILVYNIENIIYNISIKICYI